MTIENDLSLVTNWLDPIEKIYAKQSQQRERHHQQSQQVWKQEEAATFTTDKAVAAIESASKLSASARKILKDRDKKLTQQFELGYKSLPVATQDLLNEVAIQKQDITKDHVDLITRLKQQVDTDGKRKISDEAIAKIKSLHGYNELRLNQIVGQQVLDGSIATIGGQIEAGGKLEDGYIQAKRLGRVSEFFEKQQIQLLRNVGLSDKFIATEYLPQIKKFAKTKTTLASLDFKTASFAKENQENIALIEAINKLGFDNPIAKDAAAQLVGNMLKENQGDRNNVMTFLYKATKKENGLDEKFIAAIKEGVIEGHPAAKFGKDLLSADDWKFLEQSRRDFDLNKINDANAAVQQQLITGLADLRNGDTVNRQALLTLGTSYGLQETAIYKQLESFNTASLDPVIQQNESDRAATLIKSGNLEALKNFKDEIQNPTVLKQVEAEIKRQDTLRKTFGYDENIITGDVYKLLGKTFIDGQRIDSELKPIINHLTEEYRRQWQVFSSQEPPNPDPHNAAIDALNAYKEKNGFFASQLTSSQWSKDAKNDPKIGLLTATSDGKFPNFKRHIKETQLRFNRFQSVIERPTVEQISRFDNELNKGMQTAETSRDVKGDTTWERFLNTPGSIVPESELLGMLESKKISSEFYIKCHMLGISNPFDALSKQLQASAESFKKQNIDIRKLAGQFDEASSFAEKIEAALANDPNLLFAVSRGGYVQSPKKTRRMLALIEAQGDLLKAGYVPAAKNAHIAYPANLIEQERRGNVKDVDSDLNPLKPKK